MQRIGQYLRRQAAPSSRRVWHPVGCRQTAEVAANASSVYSSVAGDNGTQSTQTIVSSCLRASAADEPLPRINVVVDAGFTERMNGLEFRSFFSQVQYCHTAVRNCHLPALMHLARFNPSLHALAEERKVLLPPEMRNTGIHSRCVSEKPVWEMFAREKLVFLSPDSDNILQDVDCDHVYVFGGIVDHQIVSNMSLDFAQENGIAHARLPLLEAARVRVTPVLAINQAVEIIVGYVNKRNWRRAVLDVVPHNKWMAPVKGLKVRKGLRATHAELPL